MAASTHLPLEPFASVAALLASADAAEDVFGPLVGAPDEQLRALACAYRRIVLVVHPDKQGAPAARDAEATFVKATTLRRHAEAKIRAGTYGDRRPPPPERAPIVITTRRRAYVVGEMLASGDLCDLYACTFETARGKARGMMKVTRTEADSDLALREAETLGQLYPASQPEEKFYRYLPRLFDSFVMRGEDGSDRRANVLQAFDAHVSLADVLEAHPGGLDFRDVAWMTKRLLVALGFVHREGVVHGAVLPSHVLVHPTDHGARLVDFCYAVATGARVRAMSRPWRSLYAPEIAAKRAATPATDIYMAAKCALVLLGTTDAPEPLRKFLATCTAESPMRRPDDAWKLHEELDELLRRLVGKPKYRPLTTSASTRSHDDE